MAGLGEVCSHVAAVAFFLHIKYSKVAVLSCTDKLSVWNVPKTAKVVFPKKIKDIDWGKLTNSYTSKF